MPEKKAIERLEALVNIDKKVSHALSELDKGRDDLREAKSQLKDLKALDPERLKKNVAELKKKNAAKTAEVKTQSKELANLRKKLRDTRTELTASKNEADSFYVSSCKRWELFLTGFQYQSERKAPEFLRVRCLDRETGTSVICSGVEGDQLTWGLDIGIPEEVTEKAAERIAQKPTAKTQDKD